MASATKIGPVAPAQVVEALTDHLPDHLPDPSTITAGLGDVTDRVREISDTATAKMVSADRSLWSRIAAAVMVMLIGLAVLAVIRSRRATGREFDVDSSPSTAPSFVRT